MQKPPRFFFGSTTLTAVAALVLSLSAPQALAKDRDAHPISAKAAVKASAKAPSKTAAKPVTKPATKAATKAVERRLQASKAGSKRTAVAETHAPVRTLRYAKDRTHAVARVSEAKSLGLHGFSDPLELSSSVALVVDPASNRILFEKNPQAVLPIASITKLMTALVVTEANQPLNEVLEITEADRDTVRGSTSRLVFGTRMTREEMLRLALMSSENRAASALGRNYPGGLPAFVRAMNDKARELGMTQTHYVDSNGLSSQNKSSAADLAKLVTAANRNPLIREFSTTPEHEATVAGRQLRFINSNRLVRAGEWEIALQKTGFITEAGHCLVMEAKVLGRPIVMVFLDSISTASRFADSVRVRHWLEAGAITASRPSRPQLAAHTAKPKVVATRRRSGRALAQLSRRRA